MSQHATELCLLLVDDLYGDVTSGVFGVLQTRGRLSLPAIVQHTRLPPRQVKHSLAVLLQQHLAFWYLSQDDDTTYYEANTSNAYAIVQFGKRVSIIEHRLGKAASSIISSLLLSGHARVEELRKAYNESQKPLADSKLQSGVTKANGHIITGVMKSADQVQDTSNEEFDPTLQKLVEAQYVSVLHESHLRSNADNRREAEQLVRVRSLVDGPMKGQDKLQFESSVADLLWEWRFGTEQSIRLKEENIAETAATRGKKRVVKRTKREEDDNAPVRKRKRLNDKPSQNLNQDKDTGEQVTASPAVVGKGSAALNGKEYADIGDDNGVEVVRNKLLSNGKMLVSSQSEDFGDYILLNTAKKDLEGVLYDEEYDNGEQEVVEGTSPSKGDRETSRPGAKTKESVTRNTVGKGRKRDAQQEDDDDKWEESTKKKKRLKDDQVQTYYQPEDTDSKAVESGGTVLRVNFDKLTVVARNERLVFEAQRAIGSVTSVVYSKFLQRIEKDIPSCKTSREEENFIDNDNYNFESGPEVTTRDLLGELRDIKGLGDSIANVDRSEIELSNLIYPRKRRRKEGEAEEAEVEEDASSDEDTMDDEDEDIANDEAVPNGGQQHPLLNQAKPGGIKTDLEQLVLPLSRTRLEEARQHLFLLSSHDPPFLTYHRRKPSRPESWSVPFTTLTHKLGLSSLFSTLSDRYGKPAHRLARILHEKGKLDEKSLTALSLLNQKSMRSALAAMHAAGFLELQEVPRDNNRQPSRTIFLWFFDPSRCALQATDGAYQAMARLLQRLKVERDAVKGVLSKAERSDVEGREVEYLTPAEMGTLEKWREVEARIWCEMARLDDFVCLLRDY